MTEEVKFVPAIGLPRDEVWERLYKYGQTRVQKKRLTLASTMVGFTIADAEYALRHFKGSLTHTANFLGVYRTVFKRYIELNPHMSRVQREIEEEKKDIAEYKLFKQVEEEYFPAISFYLRTMAKERGYTERATVEHEIGTDAVRNAAGLIEAMKRGASKEEAVWVEAEPQPQES